MLQTLADNLPAMIAYYENHSLRCLFANKLYAGSNGWNVESIIGKTVREVIGEESWKVIEPHVAAVLRGQKIHYIRPMALPDGQQRFIEVNLIPHFDEHGELIGAFVLIYDITHHEQAKQAIRDSEERLRKFASVVGEGVFFHKDGILTDVNVALLALTGHTREEVIGHNLLLEFIPPEWRQVVSDYISAGREDAFEIEVLHKDGSHIAVEAVGKTTHINGEIHRLGVLRDIRARKQAEAQIRYLAHHDVLTGLPNRALLTERLNGILALAKRHDKLAAILFIDMDGLKIVNDTLGHHVGDALLQQTAGRIKEVLRESDMVARLGGDEFLVALSDMRNMDAAAKIAIKLQQKISEPMQINGRQLTTSASIGISLYPNDADNADELISLADTAMYSAKDSGHGRAHFYSSSLAATAPKSKTQ